MPNTWVATVCVAALVVVVGCSHQDGGAGGAGGAGAGGHVGIDDGYGGDPWDAGTDGAAGGDGGSTCAGAVANGACATEGMVCGGNCTEICQFCNLLRCTGGRWQPQEVAPASCFACGPSLLCQTNTQFCRIQVGGAVTNPPSYQCRATPARCLPTPSCLCLRNQGAAETTCTEGDAGAGQITTTLLAP